jgi:hypothetical protein
LRTRRRNRIGALLLEKAGVRAAARYQVPQFLAVPYIVSGTRLVVTVPQKLAQRAAGPFGLVWFTPPLKLPPLQTNIFWHRRYGQDRRRAVAAHAGGRDVSRGLKVYPDTTLQVAHDRTKNFPARAYFFYNRASDRGDRVLP